MTTRGNHYMIQTKRGWRLTACRMYRAKQFQNGDSAGSSTPATDAPVVVAVVDGLSLSRGGQEYIFLARSLAPSSQLCNHTFLRRYQLITVECMQRADH
jgi:hypothetical protein